MKYINAAVALATLASPVAYAQGTAAVVNMCDTPAYVWSVSNVQAPMVVLPNQTVGYQEPYHNKPDMSGISIKIAPTHSDGSIDMSQNITQFEYTLEPGTNQVWYDISYVNGNAYQGKPVLLQPSDLSCPNVTCAASDSVCKAVYNNPNDDLATHVCGSDADLFFLLCPPNNDDSTTGSTTPSSGSTGSTGSSKVATSGSVSEGLGALTEDASGNIGQAAAPVPQTSSKDVTQPALNVLTSINALSNIVDNWITYSAPTKRDEEHLAVRHSHKDFHSRRNRIARHSH